MGVLQTSRNSQTIHTDVQLPMQFDRLTKITTGVLFTRIRTTGLQFNRFNNQEDSSLVYFLLETVCSSTNNFS